MNDTNEQKKKERVLKAIKASVIFALCAIISGAIMVYLMMYLQSFWYALLLTIPIMGICLVIFVRFTKIKLTVIEALVVLSIVSLLLATILPATPGSGGRRPSIVRCRSNLRQIHLALLFYLKDHENQWPAEDSWCDSLVKKFERPQHFVMCIGDKQGPHSYAVNKDIFGLNSEEMPDTVLIFESVPGKNQVGSAELLTAENHKGKGCNVVFGDGHTEFIRKEDFDKLKWKAENDEVPDGG